jgi:hypothetical protein
MTEELGPLARAGQAISIHVYETGHFGWDPWDSASDKTAGWKCRACALIITAPLEEILANPLGSYGLEIREVLLKDWIQAGFADRKKTLWQRILDED